MVETEKKLRDLIKKGQGYEYIDKKHVDDYKGFVRRYTGILNNIVKTKRLCDIGLAVYEVRGFIEIINPELTNEIQWLKDVESVLVEWHDNKVSIDKLLGLKYNQGD